jgi:RHS repeat-associated protein
MAAGRQRFALFSGRVWRGMSLWIATITAASMVTALPGVATADSKHPAPQQVKRLPHSDLAMRPVAMPTSPPPPASPPASWPAPGEADVDLAKVDRRNADGPVPQRAGSLPVLLAAGSGKAHVRVADRDVTRRAGVTGVLVSVTPTESVTSVGVDYSGFGNAAGASYGSRLRLVSLPGCALTTPDKPECQVQTPLPSTNDTAAHTVTAQVAAKKDAPVVVAAAAGPGGPQGQFTASSLAPSGSWSVGGASGEFTWSYPIETPPTATGGPPGVNLSYSSGGVDGRTAATNGQSSFVGQGWDYSTGYVERSYRTCADDKTLPQRQQTGDLCWVKDILTLNLAGTTTALVHDDAHPDVWKGQSDNGSRVELLTGGGVNNGAYQSERWKVTTPDGVQYFFGSRPEASSTWTAPVYGPRIGDPCYDSDFAKAFCAQAYRWNLDYVLDTHGNATAYYYDTETNYYGNNMETKGVQYVRSGLLNRIEYGLRDTGHGIGGQTAPGLVKFDTSERCDPTVNPKVNCGDPAQMTKDNALSWPDVPVDQKCSATETCNTHAPTFWTTRKLTAINTFYNTGSGPVKVDSYALDQQLPGTGFGDRELRLDSITRTGYAKDGSSLAMPPVRFTYQLMDNRVLGYNNLPAMAHWRITNIATDTGSSINVTYSERQCTKDTVPTDPSTVDKLCYPVKWNPVFFPNTILDYFHKYVTTEVDIQDLNGVSPTQVTTYKYLGKPAWHHDENELVKPADRTYGQFRGYGQVEVRTGTATDTRTLTRTTYFLGMDGDTLPDNGKRKADVRNSLGEVTSDNNLFADQVHEVETFNGENGPRLSSTITDPVLLGTTATRTRKDMDPLNATIVSTRKSRALTDLAAGGFRTAATTTTNRYDSLGRAVASTSSGDGVADICTATSYADNTDAWIRGKAKEVVTYAAACPDEGTPPATKILSDVRTYYDQSGQLGQVSRGDASRTEAATDKDGQGRLTFATTARATVDPAGRPLTSTDALNHVTTTAYTPADGGILSQTVITNAKQQSTTAVYEPSRGKATASIDIAGHRTDAEYDLLGRLTALWNPGQAKGFNPASAKYEYLVRTDGPLAVTSHTLVDYGKGTNYVTTVNIYDALGQLRQSQSDAEGGGRIVKDTFYDSHGWTRVSNNRYYTDGDPSSTIVSVADSAVNDRTITAFDGSGRVTVATAYKGLQAMSSTRTVYGGDRTTVLPPQGGVPTTSVVDTRGRTVEMDHYTTPPVVTGDVVTGGAPQVTKYHYTANGLQDSLTDTANVTWTYQYDFQGRKISQTDPDAGTSTTAYDAIGKVTSTKDGRGQVLSYEYDELGRQTVKHDGPSTGPKLTEWTWDTLQVGKLTSSVRHTADGDYVVASLGYDDLGQSRGSRIVIPAGDKEFAGTYRTTTATTTTGLPISVHPHYGGGLPDEILQTTYDKFGRPKTLQGDFDYVSDSTYTPFGEPSQYLLSSLNNSAALTYGLDEHTRRLTEQHLSITAGDPLVSDTKYFYDPAGNPTKTVETRGTVSPQVRTQCYQYDTLARLAQAWTATDDCASAPTKAKVGGENPYWTSWSFETNGLRRQQVKHAVGTATADTTTNYNYPVGATQPHTLTSTDTTGAGTTGYTYDPSGNTLTRAVSAGNQTLTWTQENRLATVTTPAGRTSYVYDADGGQLIRRDPTGSTLFLPGEELVRAKNTGEITGTRYYSHNGTTVALRVGAHGNPKYLMSDPHGTGQVAVDSVSHEVSRRDSDPYGNELGQVQGEPWPDQHGFLGKSRDEATGLTDVGARNYDPTIGRFVSADPVMEAGSPAELNGYTYAGSNPVTNSDPSGLTAGSWCVTQACIDAGAGSPGLSGYGYPPPPPPAPSTPSKSKKQTVKVLKSVCVEKKQFVGFRGKPWEGYMVTVAGIEYTGILHDDNYCSVGIGQTGPPSCGPADFLVTWLEPQSVTAKKYNCGKRGSSTFVAGCNDAVMGPGPQSFGDDMKDLAGFIYDFSGAKDVVQCAFGGSDNRGESCAWAAASLVPFGLGKAAKAIESGARIGGDIGKTAFRDTRFIVDSDGVIDDLANPLPARGGSIPVPKLDGGTLQQVGNPIWGNSDPLALIGTRSPAQLRGLASLGDARKLQDFYAGANKMGTGGTTAPNRVILLQEIIDAWGG